jgi:glyoxylase-like metal-dependent hydrolase (beta-lactamase superfamily II)
MRRRIVLGVLIFAGALSISVAARQQGGAAPMVVTVDKIKDNFYVMKGGGGNSSVFITAEGVTVVDTKNPGWGQPLLDKIKSVTDKPIVRIINTHTHGDHVSGNVEFPATVDVVTHENTKKNMEAMRPAAFVAPPAGGPPPNIFTQNNGKGMAKRTYKDKMTIGKGADQVDLYYFGRAHTNGDTFVFFPAHRILHMADVFPNKGTPGMDSNNGGSGVEYAGTLTKVADFADKSNVDIIVNGHNDTTSTRADLRQYIQFVGDYVKFAQDEKKAGKSVDDAVKEWKVPGEVHGLQHDAERGSRQGELRSGLQGNQVTGDDTVIRNTRWWVAALAASLLIVVSVVGRAQQASKALVDAEHRRVQMEQTEAGVRDNGPDQCVRRPDEARSVRHPPQFKPGT